MDLIAKVNCWERGVTLRYCKTDKAKEQWYDSECKQHAEFEQQMKKRKLDLLLEERRCSIYIDLPS